jgi:flagellin
MGFRINHNIPAQIATGNLMKTQAGLQTSIERLSSGLRINRGADDAAGLTISEKLRGQIRGLNRAIGNAQDGISLIQTAEGALNEDASILNRLRELAIQSQADSLTINDRLEIQKEVDQMVEEIDRVSKTTEFNTKKLLDGSANALVSTDNNDLTAFQVGSAGPSAGDYAVNIRLEDSGVKQVQASLILKDKDSGQVAGLGTQLKDLESFYDNDGNLVLDAPTMMTLRGNGEKTDVTLSADMTLQEVADALQTAITTEVIDGGLGIKGSEFAYNTQKGQVFFVSGRDGSTGEIAMSVDENIVRAFGFQIITEAEPAAFKISATDIGVLNPVTNTASANTTTSTARGVVGGLDLKFQLPAEARIDGTQAAVDSVTIGPNAVVFTFHDTNAQLGSNDIQAAGSMTAGVTITLTANRTYTLASIESRINLSIAGANDPTNAFTNDGGGNPTPPTSSSFQNPGITASFDGFDLLLTSSTKGSSGTISINANAAASELLGLNTGNVGGKGGTNATLTGTKDISAGITLAGTGTLLVRVADGDFNLNAAGVGNGQSVSNGGDIAFTKGVNLSATSVIDVFNSYFSTNNVKASATLTSDGKLEIRTTETGGDSRLSIFLPNGADTLSDFGFIDGQSGTGSGGSAAVYVGNTNDVAKDLGYTLSEHLFFRVTDKSGSQTGSIAFGTDSTSQTGESFTISQDAITSILNASTMKTTDVDFGFDVGGRLDFFSRSTGKGSRVVLTTSSATQETVGRVGFGIDFSTATQGSGTTDFTLHVTDRSLRFQIGANKSQHLKFEIVNSSAEALGLKGLDVTNVKTATKALGDIDRAVNAISSERSKLGSLQNRMTSTISNLTVTSTNLQATESLIRDVDVAKETVEFTRSQILIQAGTAQLAQAKGLTQGAIQLLQG